MNAQPKSQSMTRLMSLSRWLHQTYGPDAPTMETARRWAREGRISPSPIKCGREYFVAPHAAYFSCK